MRKEAKIKFVKSREGDGCSLYDLVVDGKVVESELDIQQVVERINAQDEDIGARHTRAPEDQRRPFRRRAR